VEEEEEEEEERRKKKNNKSKRKGRGPNIFRSPTQFPLPVVPFSHL
jgi:hypothetical protein